MKYGVGIEIGATKQQIAVGSEDGALLRVITGIVDTELGAREVLRWLGESFPKVIEGYEDKISGVGIGFGGIVEYATGRVLLSVQVRDWEDINLKTMLEEKYKMPVHVENDTVLGGVAEFVAGSGKGTSGFFYTNIGSGIGGAIFTDGACITGQNFGAAYFGHTRIPSWDAAGESVTVESLCSGFAIEKRLRTPGYVPQDSKLMELAGGDVRNLGCKQLEQAEAEGDAFAAAEIRRVGHSFGTGLANIVTLLHPQRISIGGGVARIGKPLFDAVNESCFSLAFAPLRGGVEIVPCAFGQEAVLVGASLLACGKWRAQKKNEL